MIARFMFFYKPGVTTALAAAQSARKTAAPGTGTGVPQMDQRLLTNTWPKQSTTISIHANKC